MTKTIQLPFFLLKLIEANRSHIKFFSDLFFELNDEKETNNRSIFEIEFKPIKKRLQWKVESTSGKTVDGNFVVLDTKQNQAIVDFSQVESSQIRIVAHPYFDLYHLFTFLIEPIMIIQATHQQILFIHASATASNNQATIYPAWRHTGKTHRILQAVTGNKSFMADDYVLLTKKEVYSYPKTINLFSYNFRTFPQFMEALTPIISIKLRLFMKIKTFLYKLSQFSSGSLSKILYRLSQLAEVATNIRLTPYDLGLHVAPRAKLHSIQLLQTNGYTAKKLQLQKSKLASKITTIIEYELKDFWGLYQQYKFLFPSNEHNEIDSFSRNYYKLAMKLLDIKPHS